MTIHRALTIPGARGRSIDLRVHTPVEPGPRPVVVVAPDLLQDLGAAPIPEAVRGLAEAGFLVAAYGAPASRARETTFATALEDLKTVTDVLFERAALDGGLGERIDNHRIGV